MRRTCGAFTVCCSGEAMKRAIGVIAFLAVLPLGPAQASVLCVQEFLLQTAFDPGPADGAWGRRTATALEEFFAQAGEGVEGGLGKENAGAICEVFSGPRNGELLEMGAYRVYPVSVDLDQISAASARTSFDFSKFDIATNASFHCRFVMTRRIKSSGAIDSRPLVDGEVSIVNGRLEFGDHKWYVNGQSDETYLTGEANLRLTRSGQIVGMTPYFHMFWGLGQVGEVPFYVTFSRAFTPEGEFPNGLNEFDVEGPMEDGRFKLTCE